MSGFFPFSARALVRASVTALVLGTMTACREEAPPEQRPLEVVVETVQPTEEKPTVEVTGEIAARISSDLSFRVSGRIVKRQVEVGEHVTPEQALATLDPQEQQANVDSARAGVQAAEAKLRQASSTFSRQETLIRQGYTTRREYDAAEEALRSSQGALDVARAQLGTAEDQLSQTVLRPGAAGIITTRHAEAGQVVQAAQAVFTLAQDGPRDAIFYVHETLVRHGLADKTIHLALVSDPGVAAEARLREVSPTVDPANGTVRVKFEIVNPPAAMTLGASVVGTAVLAPMHRIVIPWSALSSSEGRAAVWLMDPRDKTVSLRTVEIERYDLERVVVRKGIPAGAIVVTRGVQLLRPGQIVAPITAART